MKLSILVCSVMSRRNSFLPKILEQLNDQTENTQDVEVICVVDNKTRMLGIKRNDLVNMAQGDYVTFVDDDDKLSPDYVSSLLNAINSCDPDTDVINFIVNVSLDGSEFKPCYYTVDHKHDFNRENSYHRLPNHIMCIKRQLCIDTPYKPILRGEDAAFSQDLLPKIKKEFDILKVLYEYHYNSITTETQQNLRFKKQK